MPGFSATGYTLELFCQYQAISLGGGSAQLRSLPCSVHLQSMFLQEAM